LFGAISQEKQILQNSVCLTAIEDRLQQHVEKWAYISGKSTTFNDHNNGIFVKIFPLFLLFFCLLDNIKKLSD